MKSSLRIVACVLAVTFALTARAVEAGHDMDGTWKPSQAEIGGQPMPLPVLKTITLKLTGANYEVTVDTEKGKAIDKGTVALDDSTTPKGMTITGVEGPNAGKTYPAIYEFKGDTLRVCYDLSGSKRPSDFKSAPGTALYLVTYERAK